MSDIYNPGIIQLTSHDGSVIFVPSDGEGAIVDLSASGGGGGLGTVTTVSIVSANGLAGTVATPTTTPAITLSTTITGLLKGNGTAISAASAGTDYQAPITLTTTGTSGAATFIANTLNIPQYAGGVTSFSGDGVLISNSASTGAVTVTLANSAANTVWGNNTGSSAAPGYQTSIAISGTMASAANTITSASANALVVGANGATNPAFNVDASTASSATGINVKSAAAGGGVTLSVLSSGANEGLIINPKGAPNFGTAFGTVANRTTVKYTGASGTASGYVVTVFGNYINCAGAFWQGAFIYDTTFGASQVQCTAATGQSPTIALSVAPAGSIGGTATFTVVANATASGFAVGKATEATTPLDVTGDTGITSGNLLVSTVGKGIQIKGGTNARIGTGTLTGGSATIANTSVTANTRVFLTDTSGSVTNVGSLTVVTTAGTGFVVSSTNILDTSTFNWFLMEQN